MPEEQHDPCAHLAEINDVKQQRKVRWLVFAILLGGLGGALVFTINVSLEAGALAAEVRSVDQKAAGNQRDIREIRNDRRQTERTRAQEHQQEMESLGRIEERLDGFNRRLESLESARASSHNRRR